MLLFFKRMLAVNWRQQGWILGFSFTRCVDVFEKVSEEVCTNTLPYTHWIS